MAGETERIVVRVTPVQKRAIASTAKDLGLNEGWVTQALFAWDEDHAVT